jgi:hypothetical protein
MQQLQVCFSCLRNMSFLRSSQTRQSVTSLGIQEVRYRHSLQAE